MTLLACQPRSASAIADAVLAVDPEHNVELLHHDVDGDGQDENFCNFFVHQVTTLLGCPVPRVRANDQLDWLKGEGSAVHGWRQVFPTGAMDAAGRGQPVVVGWKNPKPRLGRDGKQLYEGSRPLYHSGHVALVRATPAGELGIWIAQAGRTNFNLDRLVKGFGSNAPLLFFAHD